MTSFRDRVKFALQILPFILLALLALSFFFISPETIVARLGVGNAYLFLAILAFLGGISTFGSVPYAALLVSLASGGFHPLILGATAAIAVTLGDSVTYFLGYHGRRFLGERSLGIVSWISDWQNKHPRLTPLLIFGYGAFIPLSNDVLTISMGLSRYPIWKLMPALLLGTVLFNTALAYATVYFYDSVRLFF